AKGVAFLRAGAAGLLAALVVGCGSTRSTDTQRCATEMLLVSNAIDQAVNRLDFSALRDQPVFLDVQYLDNTVDKGYLISSVRQHLAAHGCLLREKREEAEYVVELRSGGVGTDRYELLIGVPQMNLSTIVPGQPSYIPEIPFAKKTDQHGIAKIAAFVYHRESGRALGQSGTLEGTSTAKDTWVLGTGPFRRGSIVHGTSLAGSELPLPDLSLSGDAEPSDEPPERVSVTAAATWAVPPADEPPAAGAPPATGVAASPGAGAPPATEVAASPTAPDGGKPSPRPAVVQAGGVRLAPIGPLVVPDPPEEK
ncbi:MAG TPA: DUF6655 family protein, partial [Gemmataceae bacterium]